MIFSLSGASEGGLKKKKKIKPCTQEVQKHPQICEAAPEAMFHSMKI